MHRPERITLSNGKPFWRFADGTLLPVVSGGDGPTTPPAPAPAPPAPVPPTTPQPAPVVPPATDQLSALQAELNRVGAQERRQGESAATKALLEQLGVQTVEEAKAVLDRQREADQAAMTEAQRAQAAAETAKTQAEADRAAAAEDRRLASVERVLMASGLQLGNDPETQRRNLDRAVRMLPADATQVDQIAAAVAQLRVDMPQLFAAAAPATTNGGQPVTTPVPGSTLPPIPGAPPVPTAPPAPSSTAGGPPPAPQAPQDAYAMAFTRGRQLARGRPNPTPIEPVNAGNGTK